MMGHLWVFLGGLLTFSFIYRGNAYRLPETALPVHYTLKIITHLDDNDFRFAGQVWIKAIAANSARNITLHSKDLTLDEKKITVNNIEKSPSTSNPIEKITYDKEYDFVIIHLQQALKENEKYEIYIPFSAKLNDSLAGYYRSSYEDAKGEKRWLAVTQFEPIDARRAFPCFDEPAMKATFEISLGRKEQFSSISNMPLLETTPLGEGEGWFWDKYEESVPMSTYLVAFMVSDFGYMSSSLQEGSNVTFRVWAKNDSINLVKYANEVGPKCLSFYEKFFEINYPLPKQDMVAVPDFSAGAMENWGLITYREAYLLFDPQTSTATQKHSIASIIAHELAHQWFGNLVTMKWWTDLWLNEGFATYMAGVAVHKLYPEWNSLNEETLNNLLGVFSLDSLKTSHPVSVPITNPNRINEIFDTISYKKGSFLLRMMDNFLGSETFRKGVAKYLAEHKFGNAEQDDLWTSLTNQAHNDGVLPKDLTVKKIMDTWTLQTGYPLVTVKRDYEKNVAGLSQERYLRDKLLSKETGNCWWVPITYTNQKEFNFEGTQSKNWLSCPSNALEIEAPPADNWLILNIQATGLYRINYDERNWKMLSDFLNNASYTDIETLNRVQLISDSAALSWTGEVDYKIFFEIVQYIKREKEYLPWRAALASLDQITTMLKRTSSYGELIKFYRTLLTPIYESLGGLQIKENDSLESLKFHTLIASWACKYRVGNCISEAKELFKQWQAKPEINPIPKEMRTVVYCTALREGKEKEWNFLWQEYLRNLNPTEKPKILRALSCTEEVWLLNRYLEYSNNPDSGVRKQDASSVFSGVARNEVGFYVAKNFLFNRIAKIHAYLAPNARRLSNYISTIGSEMISEEDYNEFKNFTIMNNDYLLMSKQSVEQSLETVRLHIQWQKAHFDYVSKYVTGANLQ